MFPREPGARGGGALIRGAEKNEARRSLRGVRGPGPGSRAPCLLRMSGSDPDVGAAGPGP